MKRTVHVISPTQILQQKCTGADEEIKGPRRLAFQGSSIHRSGKNCGEKSVPLLGWDSTKERIRALWAAAKSARALGDVHHVLALRDQNIDLPQLRNDLFRFVSLPCHYSPP
jgi:hypothetical protein